MTARKLSPSDATALVESYRVKLGLRPWSELGKGSRSGRTTHTILCAIARAASFPGERVMLSVDPALVNYCRDMVHGYAARLHVDGSSVEVVTIEQIENVETWRDRRIVRLFVDHYFDAQTQRERDHARFQHRRGSRT